MGLLDCVNNARIQVGVGRLDDLDVLGLAVAVDSERETDRGIHGNEGLGRPSGSWSASDPIRLGAMTPVLTRRLGVEQ